MTIIQLLGQLQTELAEASFAFEDEERRTAFERLTRARHIVGTLRYVMENIDSIAAITDALDYRFQQPKE